MFRNYAHGTPHNTAESTVDEIKRIGLPHGPLARLLAINGRGKISYLGPNGLTDRILAGQTDPSLFHEGHYVYELVHFKLFTPKTGSSGVDLRIMLKASPAISITSCFAIPEQLHELFRTTTLVVEIRPDSWFPTDQQFPDIFPFSKVLTIPDPAVYTLQPFVGCAESTGHPMRCSGQNFLP